jgi:phospholipid-binding lipoprotein MlaA
MSTKWASRFLGLLLVACASLAGCAVGGRGAALRADGAGGPDPLAASDAAVMSSDEGPGEVQEHDPWEPFNERTFEFNYELDRVVVKPVAKGWRKAVPEPMRDGIQNVFRNLGMPRRFVNNLLQGKVEGAVRELTGFIMNSSVGVGGLFDVAKGEGVLPPDEEDTGQTLAVYGVKPGPYLVLPFFPPSTVRDTIGSAVDGMLDPLSFVLPFVGSVAKRAGTGVNDRSMNLELFDDVEESVVDLYSAVRNLHLQRREQAIGK